MHAKFASSLVLQSQFKTAKLVDVPEELEGEENARRCLSA